MNRYLSLLLMLCVSANCFAEPTLEENKINETPDLVQTAKTANFFNGGGQYCGPVAVSDSLLWLGKQKLIPLTDFSQDAHFQLVKTLADDAYLCTNRNRGTSPNGLILGVKRYLQSIGISDYRISSRGWRNVPAEHKQGEQLSLKWISNSSSGAKVQWLNIGWYRMENGAMHRFGGHWITVVGVKAGKVLAYDPAPRNGVEKELHSLTVKPAKPFKISSPIKNIPGTAAGMLQIVDGFNLKRTTEACLIDASVCLEVHPTD